MNMIFEYPLQWLQQQQRTSNQERAKFGNHTIHKASNCLVEELTRLGAKNCVITCNLRIKNDGMPYSNQGKITDPAIVIYFDLKGKAKAMACDKYDLIEHNIWALYLSVGAIRGLERWGGSSFLDGLFTGFTALPPPVDNIVQYFDGCLTLYEVETRYKQLRKLLHPDTGGSNEEFSEMMRQYRNLEGK